MKTVDKQMNTDISQLLEQLEIYKTNHDIDKLFKYATFLMEISNLQKDYYHKGIGLYYMSLSSYYSGQYDVALMQSKEGLALCESNKSSNYYVLLCNMVGVNYGTLQDYTNALKYLLKAYYASADYAEGANLYMSLCNIGTIFHRLEFYDKAIEYFLLSMKERKMTYENMNEMDGICLVNLYGSYILIKDYEQMKIWEEKLIAFNKRFYNENTIDDYYMYQILLAYDKKDYPQIEELSKTMIKNASNNADELHIFKNLIEVLAINIKIKNKFICNSLIDILESIVRKHPKISNETKLIDLLVQKSIVFHEHERLPRLLMHFYENKKKEELNSKLIEEKGIIDNIELERVLHEQNIILKKNEELLKNNELDEFTMVYNKTYFTKHVEEELKKQQFDGYQALILIDIDNFKEINDTYGHNVGDEVLIQVADLFSRSVRNNEYVGRIGGDEFCIFMKNIYTQKYLKEKLDSLQHQLHNIEIDHFNQKITASIGICLIDSPVSFKQIYEKADEAMYKVKKSGRDRYCILYLK